MGPKLPAITSESSDIRHKKRNCHNNYLPDQTYEELWLDTFRAAARPDMKKESSCVYRDGIVS